MAADFPGFSIHIRRGSRNQVSVLYESGSRSTTFEGSLTGEGWKQIELLIPADFQADRLDLVVASLAKGIGEVGYEYRILRRGDAEAVPESEREAALAELRKMGWEPEVSADRAQVELKRTDGAAAPSPQEAIAQSERMARLVAALHGTRYKLEELARSTGAVS